MNSGKTACDLKDLAINGGPKTRQDPMPCVTRFDGNELVYLKEALAQNTLFYCKGGFTKRFHERFRKIVQCNYSVACSSGTAAIHIALGALGIGTGDEVITTSITDMGTVIGILYQNAVPVFCDNVLSTYGMDIIDLERKITDRTKAIIMVHLAGNPCDIDGILKVADKHKIPLIEDCAQAWGSLYKNKHVGSFGTIGCFSTNDTKHISTGDGGVACTNDEKLYHRMHLYADKQYDRLSSVNSRSSEELSPNYRWSELQAAVGLAQLEKVERIAAKRSVLGDRLSMLIRDCAGILVPEIGAHSCSSYWFYMFRLDPHVITDRSYFVQCLNAEGIPANPGYIPTPIYRYPLFRNQAFFAGGWPAKMLGLTDVDYGRTCCAVAERILTTAVVLPLNEAMSETDISNIAEAVKKVSDLLAIR
jgi:perosamine synthetase